MDLLDTVAHLYENENVQERNEPSLLAPISYNCKDAFPGERSVCDTRQRDQTAYRYSNNISEECIDNCIDVTNVVECLDDDFRQKINTEIENLRVNINDIINERQMNYRTVFGLQQEIYPPQQVPVQVNNSRSSSTDNIATDYQMLVDNGKEQMSVEESPASTYNSYGTSEGEQVYSNFGATDVQPCRENQNAIADSYLIRLMTATLIIGNTLRRKEYKV